MQGSTKSRRYYKAKAIEWKKCHLQWSTLSTCMLGAISRAYLLAQAIPPTNNWIEVQEASSHVEWMFGFSLEAKTKESKSLLPVETRSISLRGLGFCRACSISYGDSLCGRSASESRLLLAFCSIPSASFCYLPTASESLLQHQKAFDGNLHVQKMSSW